VRPIEIEAGKWVVDYGSGPFFYPEIINLEAVPRYLEPVGGTVLIIAALVGIILLGLLISRLEDQHWTDRRQSRRRHIYAPTGRIYLLRRDKRRRPS
jgi:hypothetical protein